HPGRARRPGPPPDALRRPSPALLPARPGLVGLRRLRGLAASALGRLRRRVHPPDPPAGVAARGAGRRSRRGGLPGAEPLPRLLLAGGPVLRAARAALRPLA